MIDDDLSSVIGPGTHSMPFCRHRDKAAGIEVRASFRIRQRAIRKVVWPIGHAADGLLRLDDTRLLPRVVARRRLPRARIGRARSRDHDDRVDSTFLPATVQPRLSLRKPVDPEPGRGDRYERDARARLDAEPAYERDAMHRRRRAVDPYVPNARVPQAVLEAVENAAVVRKEDQLGISIRAEELNGVVRLA
eukprot:6173066-Pleurochrysis_carterae.AAC.2